MDSDSLEKFEEENYDWLSEKFMQIPEVIDLWSQFVEDEYNKKMPDEDILRGDR